MNPPAARSKLHILFVLENYFPNVGGVEILFKSLAGKLSDQGHQITIVTTRLSPEHPKEEVLGNIQILRYNFRNRYLFTLLAAWPVWRLAKQCDLVHTTSYNAALPAFIGAWLRGKKVIVTFHEVWDKLWFNLPHMSRIGARLHWLFEQMLLRLPVHRFVGVSQTTSDALMAAGVSPKKIATILNGIDYQDFTNKKNESGKGGSEHFTYTFFGRLGVSKGLDILLEASQFFLKKHPEGRLRLIVPSTPPNMFRWLRNRVHELKIESQVELLHHLPFEELKSKLVDSDGVVIPSLSEGFCFAAVESMALDVPIISSGKGALAEVIGGRHLVMNNYSAKALADALELAKAGEWQTVPKQKFELETTVSNYLQLYRELLPEKSQNLVPCE